MITSWYWSASIRELGILNFQSNNGVMAKLLLVVPGPFPDKAAEGSAPALPRVVGLLAKLIVWVAKSSIRTRCFYWLRYFLTAFMAAACKLCPGNRTNP